MATSLSRSTSLARKAIIFFIVFAIFTYIMQFVLGLVSDKPTPPPGGFTQVGYKSIDEALGKIPSPKLESLKLAPGTQASYSLDGRIPLFPPVVNVYKIRKPRETLGSVSRARQVASVLGFSEADEERRSDDILVWENTNISRTLEYNKVLQEWKYNLNIKTDASTNTIEPLNSDVEYYRNGASGFLSNLGISNSYFTQINSRVDFINILDDGSFERILNPRDAQFARIAIYKNLEAVSLLENYTPAPQDENPAIAVTADVRKYNFLNGPANVIIQGDGSQPDQDYIRFEYKDFEYGESGVYQLITSEQAWNNIQANQGTLIWLRPEDKDIFDEFEEVEVIDFEADVDSIRLIYMEPDQWLANEPWTQFVQPYYIFEGIATLRDGRRAEFSFIEEALSSSSYLAQ